MKRATLVLILLAALGTLAALILSVPRPLDAAHRAHYAALARCLGWADTLAPRLHITRTPPRDPANVGEHRAGRVRIHPALPKDIYWRVLAHEWVHVRYHDPEHRRPEWAHSTRCGLYPP